MVKMYGPDAAPAVNEDDHDLTSLLQTLMAQQQKVQASKQVRGEASNTRTQGLAPPVPHRSAPKSRRTNVGSQRQSTSAAMPSEIPAPEAGPSNLASVSGVPSSPASWSHLLNATSSPPAFPFLAMNFDQDDDEEADPDFDPFSIDPDFDLDASLQQMGMTRANMEEINNIMFATGTSPAFPQQQASSAASTPAGAERAAAAAPSAPVNKDARGTKRRRTEANKPSRSKAKETVQQATLRNTEPTGALSGGGSHDENNLTRKGRGRPRKYDTVEEAREVKNLKRSRARAEERVKQEEADKLEKRNKHLESKVMELNAENKVLRRELAMLRKENAEIRAHKIANNLTRKSLRRGQSRASSAEESRTGDSESSGQSENSSGEEIGSEDEDEGGDDGGQQHNRDLANSADDVGDRRLSEGRDDNSLHGGQHRGTLQRHPNSDMRAPLSMVNSGQSANRPPPNEDAFAHPAAARVTLEHMQHPASSTDKLLASSRLRSPAYAASLPGDVGWNRSTVTGATISASSPSGFSPERTRVRDNVYALAGGASRLAAPETREHHRNDFSHEQEEQSRHSQQRYPASSFRDAARNTTDQSSSLQLPEGLRAILAAAQQQQQQQARQQQQQQQRMHA